MRPATFRDKKMVVIDVFELSACYTHVHTQAHTHTHTYTHTHTHTHTHNHTHNHYTNLQSPVQGPLYGHTLRRARTASGYRGHKRLQLVPLVLKLLHKRFDRSFRELLRLSSLTVAHEGVYDARARLNAGRVSGQRRLCLHRVHPAHPAHAEVRHWRPGPQKWLQSHQLQGWRYTER